MEHDFQQSNLWNIYIYIYINYSSLINLVVSKWVSILSVDIING